MSFAAAIDRAYAIGMFQQRPEIEGFLAFLAARGPVRSALEIGVLHGGPLSLWHGLASGAVVGIDMPDGPHGGRDHKYDAARIAERNARLAAEFPRLRFVTGDSHAGETWLAASAALDCATADLLFVDGDHSLLGAAQDFIDYRKLVRPGGVVAFHDIATPETWDQGCRVPLLWSDLRVRYEAHEFVAPGAPWGGIGAVIL